MGATKSTKTKKYHMMMMINQCEVIRGAPLKRGCIEFKYYVDGP